MNAWKFEVAMRQRAQALGDIVRLLQSTEETYFDFAAVNVLPETCEDGSEKDGESVTELTYGSGWRVSGGFSAHGAEFELMWFILSWSAGEGVRTLALTRDEVRVLYAADDLVREKLISGFAHCFAELDEATPCELVESV